MHRSQASRRKIAPNRYVTYQDKVISMIDLGHGMGKYTPAEIDPGKLPKAKTIDLNVFCPGLTREEVKRLKRLVLSLTQPPDLIGVTYEKSKNNNKEDQHAHQEPD
jgi:hypothetical protein